MADRQLAVVDSQRPTPVAVRAPSGPRLPLPTGAELKALQEYGDIIVKSGLAPAHIKTWQGAVVAMRFGHQLGVDEFTALQNIFVVSGKVSCMASLMHALILRDHGDDAIVPKGISPTRVTLACKRRTSQQTTEIAYTLEEAQAAGLKDGNWTKYPTDMLFARCISRAGRMLFRDSTLGMYLPEEIGVNVIEVDGDVIGEPTAFKPTEILEGEVVETRHVRNDDDRVRANARYHADGSERGLTDDALRLLAIGVFPIREGGKRTESRKELTGKELDDLTTLMEESFPPVIPAPEGEGDEEGAVYLSVPVDYANQIAAARDQKALAKIAAKLKEDGISIDALKWMWKRRNSDVPAASEGGEA